MGPLRRLATAAVLAMTAVACSPLSDGSSPPAEAVSTDTTQPAGVDEAPASSAVSGEPAVNSEAPAGADVEPVTPSASVGAVVELEYLGAEPQRWTLVVGDVRTASAGEPVESQVLLEIELTYLGESAEGMLLDLVVEVSDGTASVDALRAPCLAPPDDAIDLFASVPVDASVAGVICFGTDIDPTELIVTPLIDPPVTIELTP